MGFYPPLWGPYFWTTLHLVTLAHPNEPSEAHKKDAEAWVYAFRSIIPCEVCRIHYTNELKRMPPNVESKHEFVEWGRALHNSVNKRLGKREWEREEFFQHYVTMMYATENLKASVDVQEQVRMEPIRIQRLSDQVSALEKEKHEMARNMTKLHTAYRDSEKAHGNTETALIIAIVIVIVALVIVGALYATHSHRSRKRQR